jgi:hypothetical protein
LVRKRLTEANSVKNDESEERVFSRLRVSITERPIPFWRRTVVVPLSWVAATALILVALGFALVLAMTGNNVRMMKIISEPTGIMEVQVSAPIQDLELILRSFEKQESKKENVIQLPEGSRFFILGEPTLMRAKDLTGSSLR